MTPSAQQIVTGSAQSEVSLADSYAWCRALTKRTAKNFYYSFLTLPADRRRDMCVLYAFMRVSDDLGDDRQLPVSKRALNLKRWRAALESAMNEQRFEHPLLPALADVARRHQIPSGYLHAVIDGIEMDLEPAGFETFDELAHYCYHVAGAVGLCCIHIWGFHDRRALVRAVDCGLAFQLTNILRDLGEDAAMGRVYLPREDMRRFGYGEQEIAAHRRNEKFVELMRFQADRARHYYRAAAELYDYLDASGRPIFRAMLRIYGGLLDEIERRGYDVYTRRVTLSRWRKLMISLESIVRERWFALER